LAGRREDIPALMMHFVETFGRRMGKKIEHIPPETISAAQVVLMAWKYSRTTEPIERAVIRSTSRLDLLKAKELTVSSAVQNQVLLSLTGWSG